MVFRKSCPEQAVRLFWRQPSPISPLGTPYTRLRFKCSWKTHSRRVYLWILYKETLQSATLYIISEVLVHDPVWSFLRSSWNISFSIEGPESLAQRAGEAARTRDGHELRSHIL